MYTIEKDIVEMIDYEFFSTLSQNIDGHLLNI